MKTAISLPDNLFAAADAFAQQRDMTRSELYAKALSEYLQRHPTDNVTKKINAALKKMEGSSDQPIQEYGLESLRKLPW
jgi:metal-responsive CopG/Arc/MetJ family transcriptional regulator